MHHVDHVGSTLDVPLGIGQPLKERLRSFLFFSNFQRESFRSSWILDSHPNNRKSCISFRSPTCMIIRKDSSQRSFEQRKERSFKIIKEIQAHLSCYTSSRKVKKSQGGKLGKELRDQGPPCQVAYCIPCIVVILQFLVKAFSDYSFGLWGIWIREH